MRIDVDRTETAQRSSDVKMVDRSAPALQEKVERILQAAATIERDLEDSRVFLPVVTVMTSLRDCERYYNLHNISAASVPIFLELFVFLFSKNDDSGTLASFDETEET